MKTVIDVEKALEGLREAVAERGQDYVYPSSETGCFYWHSTDSRPGCLVGLALAKLGVPNEVLEKLDTANDGSSLGAGGFSLTGSDPVFGDGFEVTPDASSVLASAQLAQDNGESWGTALETAESSARNVSA